MLRWMAGRLSYANVIATLALFISLGGASYAVVTLPARSVGSRQLRQGAVEPSSLGFPLGADAYTDTKPETRRASACNGGEPPGSPPQNYICPLVERARPPSELSVNLRQSGQLLIYVLVGLNDQGPPGRSTQAYTELWVDGHEVARNTSSLLGGEHVQTPMQLLLPVGAGRHTVGVATEVSFNYWEGTVLITPVSVIVTVLPPARSVHVKLPSRGQGCAIGGAPCVRG